MKMPRPNLIPAEVSWRTARVNWKAARMKRHPRSEREADSSHRHRVN